MKVYEKQIVFYTLRARSFLIVKNNKEQKLNTLPSTPDKTPSSEFSTFPNTSLQNVIKHNEDLMARLSVNLRRIGHLEKIIEDLTLRLKVEKSNSDSLRDELLIFKEKNRLSEAQLQKNIGDLSRSSQKIEQLDIETKALKSDLKTQESKYEFKISQLELEIHDLNLMKENTETHLKPKLQVYEKQNQSLQSELDALRTKSADYKEKLIALSQQAQNEALKFQNIVKDLQVKVNEKDIIINKYEDLDVKVKSISKEKTILENKTIDLEHELKKLMTQRQTELEELQGSLNLKNSEIQKLKIENYELKKSWAESHNRSKDLEQKNLALEEQTQSMQYMWQEKNKKYSELESQIKILQTMRHELTLKINAHEMEIKSKNKKIDDLLQLIETMKTKGQHEKEAILETAIRGMKNLYFEEDDKKESSPVIKNIIF